MNPGRNDRCPCGSGRRFKLCCGRLDLTHSTRPAEAALSPLVGLMNAGRYQELRHRAQELLQAHPGFGPLWQLLAVAQGHLAQDSMAALRHAAQLMPGDAVAQLNLGNALGRCGRLQEAAEQYRCALRIEPEFAEAHSNLSEVLLELGELDWALVSGERAVAISPLWAEAHEKLAQIRLRLGQYESAVSDSQRALALKPALSDAHNTLGSALLKLGRHQDAIGSFLNAIEQRPDFAAAHLNLASVRRSYGHVEQAEIGYRRALEIDPQLIAAHTELATALRFQRRTQESEASCRRALELDPKCAAALVVLAELRADEGRFTEAEELYRSAIALDSACIEAWAGVPRVRKMNVTDGDWLAAVQCLVNRALPARAESYLRFALGKYFDDTQDFTAAFEQFNQANELAKGCGPRHSRPQLTQSVDRIIATYHGAWLREHGRAGSQSPRPILVVGMLRSGTTLVEQILASHPAIFGAGELSFWSRTGAAPDQATLGRLSREYLALLHGLSPDALRVVDKMPTNFFSLGLIHGALPQARIIHVRRHPIDTCLSIYFQYFEAANTYANDLQDLAHYTREYQRLMRHWADILPAYSLLEVSYEQLVAEPETWIRRLLDFVGVEWDARCLDFHQTPRTVLTASRWQVRQKINSSSVGRWRHYAPHIGPLRALVDD